MKGRTDPTRSSGTVPDSGPASESASDPGPAPWRVYLLRCADGTLYCGTTTDTSRRLAQHNGELAGGARYTRSRRPVTLVAERPCASRSEALRLEARVKKTPRARKATVLLEEDDGQKPRIRRRSGKTTGSPPRGR